MHWINDLREQAKKKWLEWHSIPLGDKRYAERELNIALYTGMIRMADAVLINNRMYDINELIRLSKSSDFQTYLLNRRGLFSRHIRLLRSKELDHFIAFLSEREKRMPRYKPLILTPSKKEKVIKPGNRGK